MAITGAVDNASETTGDLNKEAWDKYNLLRLAVLVEHDTDGTHLSTGDVVLKALFDANTILVADSDNTPAALTIAASRILGRASTGNIAALTAAQVNTILSTATRALDNLASVAINTSLISDTDDTDDLGSAAKQWKDLYIDGTANIDSLIADTADINGGTVDGITSLTAGGHLDIGAYGFRANTLTADGLTATRVIFAGANGLLSNSAAMTFVTDTLTVTKLGAFQAAGAINFDSQNMTNVDIDSGTIDGITDLAVADGGTGSSTAANARTALGVAIGSNVLAYDAGLSNLAGITMAANKFYYTSGDNTHVAGDVSVFVRTILDDADADTVLGTLGLSTNLPNLADAEVTQLEAIGDVTVSYTQWGYLGELDQSLIQTSTPTFNSLILDQGTDDDSILQWKSDDVAHGMTSLAATNIYGFVEKAQATSGGLRFLGLKDADGDPYRALYFGGVLGEDADTTKSTAGQGVVTIMGGVKSNTSGAVVNADGNVVAIRSYNLTRFIFDAEGEMHSDDIIGIGDDWDKWDDLQLASDISRLPKAKFDEMVRYKGKDFERAGLLTLSVDENGVQHAFIKNKAMHQFAMCCFAEVYGRCRRYEMAFEKLGIGQEELLALEA